MEIINSREGKIHIDSHKDERNINDVHQELVGVLDQFYYTITRVDLLDDMACVLQSAGHPEAVLQVLSWTDYLKVTSVLYIEEDRKIVLEKFSSKCLLELYQAGETIYTMAASYVKNGVLNSTTNVAFFTEYEGRPQAYVMVRNSTREQLRKRIIDMYVYDNCDYFIYLDAKNNSYTMFSRTAENVQSLPLECDDYRAEVQKYVKDSIVPEDWEMVTREMSIERVLAQMEQKKVHSFSCGVMEPGRGYTRKRIDYRYYERSTQMILLSCTDITEMYREEQEHYKVLAEALKRAQTDVLTGILNYQGIVEQISQALEKKPKHAALLFADLDNFKKVNDTLGHVVGDYVLREVAGILKRETFGEALVGRFGGDEFVIYFQNISSMDDVKAYAQRVCDGIRTLEYGQKEDANVSCSIGIVEIPKNGWEYKDLVQKADDMVYCAKSKGKNQYVIYGE